MLLTKESTHTCKYVSIHVHMREPPTGIRNEVLHHVAEPAARSASRPEKNNEGYTIFQPVHVTTAGIQSGSGVNPHHAAAHSSGHHGIPPRRRIYKEVQQKQA